jgi:acyl carrier protein
MTAQEIKAQLRPLILSSLRITEITPEEFDDSRPLLDGDLEIDSIDILQLIVEIEKKYGIKLVSGKFDRTAWRDLNSLAATILAKMEEQAKA